MISDVILTREKVVELDNGNVKHALKNNSSGFKGFGEAYFSEIRFGAVKAWKKHTKMTMNLLVPFGKVHITVYDNRGITKNFGEYILSASEYYRLTIPPNLWFGFKGIHRDKSIILNIANILHNDEEVEKLGVDEVDYNWDDIE